MKILIVNGPNLNLLGVREPGIYGSTPFDDYLPKLRAEFKDIDIDYYQSNHEGALIDRMQEAGFSYDGIVLNAGAYTHTSVALHDCIRAIATPVVEVHISNVHQREAFRRQVYAFARLPRCDMRLRAWQLPPGRDVISVGKTPLL